MDRTQLQSMLRELLENETGEPFDHVQESSDLTGELGLDSVDFVSLILQIENRLQIKLETNELQTVKTVGDLLDLILVKLPPSEKSAA